MHSQPPKSPNSPDKGSPPDKGAGGLGDLLPCLSPLIRGVQGDFGNFAKVGVIGKCLLISLIHYGRDLEGTPPTEAVSVYF